MLQLVTVFHEIVNVFYLRPTPLRRFPVFDLVLFRT
eukprot:CAMPEP_0178800882 /NCGR_PEP_ID=MMETSP0745-20121128/13062_1 /TAXON_ID=913974 /ORGANISM="Nitzschia punctata, Strain CCMP561" /LENGTH=35 /DNA_ID= /DNA_START= /DNA_END= /DNA_ORIENTATION=